MNQEKDCGEVLKDALYKVIFSRRDIRSQFLPEPVPEEMIARILYAAHHAPSVGYSQPWDFVVIRDRAVKEKVHQAFSKANEHSALLFPEGKREIYSSLKLEGIKESPLNICITYDKERFGPVVIGRTTIPLMGIFSCVCAVQNLWLAARAEGLGVGWVSIFFEDELKEILSLPEHIVPVAYLCIGYVSHFPEKPELETAKWAPRLPLDSLIHCDSWGNTCADSWGSLMDTIKKHELYPEKGENSEE
ncbi:MAG: 5,6-dimethylbenzimidazole synthase [Thermodesulfovibrionales bacterium]|jgi:5,6-dimethylbenzimidazole synthase